MQSNSTRERQLDQIERPRSERLARIVDKVYLALTAANKPLTVAELTDSYRLRGRRAEAIQAALDWLVGQRMVAYERFGRQLEGKRYPTYFAPRRHIPDGTAPADIRARECPRSLARVWEALASTMHPLTRGELHMFPKLGAIATDHLQAALDCLVACGMVDVGSSWNPIAGRLVPTYRALTRRTS